MDMHDEALMALIAPLGIHTDETHLAELACTLRKLSDAAEESRQYHELAKAILYVVHMAAGKLDTAWDVKFFLRIIFYKRERLRELYLAYARQSRGTE